MLSASNGGSSKAGSGGRITFETPFSSLRYILQPFCHGIKILWSIRAFHQIDWMKKLHLADQPADFCHPLLIFLLGRNIGIIKKYCNRKKTWKDIPGRNCCRVRSRREGKVWGLFPPSAALQLIFQALFGNLHLPILSPILTIVSYPFSEFSIKSESSLTFPC